MSSVPLILGGMLGAGVLLIVMGLRQLTNRRLDERSRRRGFWPFNAGLVVVATSVYLFVTTS